MDKKRTTVGRRLAEAVVATVLLAPMPTLATTYDYTGPAYITNADQTTFGTDLTGTVTFNFNTSSFTGSVSGLSQITNLQLTSGTYTLNTNTALNSEDYFDFSDGVITNWDVGITKIIGTQALLLGTCSPYGSSSTCFWPAQYSSYPPSGGAYPSAAFYVSQEGQYSLEAAAYTQADWSEVSSTPLPSTWTMMLIGVACFGFVAYRKQKQRQLTFTLA